MVNMMQASLGSWKCGKGRTFPTFPQTVLFIFERIIRDKITMKRGEGSTTRAKPPQKRVLKPNLDKLLTIRNCKKGDS